MKFRRVLSATTFVISLVLTTASAAIGDGFTVVIPQAAKGMFGGVSYETILVVSNPSSEAVDVTVGGVDSAGRSLLATSTFRLSSQETRKIIIAGGDPQVGHLIISSVRRMNGSAHIIAIPAGSSRELASLVVILAEPYIAKAVIPVIRNSVQLDIPVENTGVAIVNGQGGNITLRVTLLDATGAVLLTRNLELTFQGRASLFVNELFPTLPTTFTLGSLVIEGPFPYSFASSALYTTGPKIYSAAVSSVDIPLRYSIEFKTAYTDDLVSQMSAQYGFIVVTKHGGKLISVNMTDEVARAVARDPRVQSVSADGVVSLL